MRTLALIVVLLALPALAQELTPNADETDQLTWLNRRIAPGAASHPQDLALSVLRQCTALSDLTEIRRDNTTDMDADNAALKVRLQAQLDKLNE